MEGIKVSEADSELKLRITKQMGSELKEGMELSRFKTCRGIIEEDEQFYETPIR